VCCQGEASATGWSLVQRKSYRLWCVVEYEKNEEVMARVGLQRHSKKKKKKLSASGITFWHLSKGTWFSAYWLWGTVLMKQMVILCTVTWAGSGRRKANENCKIYTKQKGLVVQ
jgi:hypothetical protein